MAHIHNVFDTNEHFVIDPVTRAITNSKSKNIVIMQNDHNSERFTFQIPKVDGHNMTACDRIEIHYINIDAADKSLKSTGVYEVKDIQPFAEDNGVAVFSWLLSRNCTKYPGTLSFLIHFACTVDGVEEYAWNTAIFESIKIGNGMNNGAEAIEPYADIIAQWKADLFGVGDTEEQRLLTVSAEQQAAIAAKGAAVLDSIPDEYEALQAKADSNERIKAGAIVLDAEGESIVVNDASDCYLQGLKLFGKSTQDGTPTPDSPVEIVSVENPVVTVCGKNLLRYPYTFSTRTMNGVTFTDNGDGSITVDGTATGAISFHIASSFSLPAGKYVFSGCPLGGSLSTYRIYYSDNVTKTVADYGNTSTFTLDESFTGQVVLQVISGAVINNLTFYPMIRLASFESGDFETYTEQEISIPLALPGIPVSSGGNYTDANGQKWICDEVDLKRGVYVQRIDTKNLIGKDREDWGMSHPGTFRCHSITTAFLCQQFESIINEHIIGNHEANTMLIDGQCALRYGGTTDRAYFKWSSITTLEEWLAWLSNNPVTIIYAHKTPIETPLSDAEINAFKALHSNKPNTTILNDAGAHMAVEYVADTKTYIDNKISALLSNT